MVAHLLIWQGTPGQDPKGNQAELACCGQELPDCVGRSVPYRDCCFVYALHACNWLAGVLPSTLKGSTEVERR